MRIQLDYRWKDWKLIHGVNTSSFADVQLSSEWLKPIESPELPDITGDSCFTTDADGNVVARCLFNINGKDAINRIKQCQRKRLET